MRRDHVFVPTLTAEKIIFS